MQPMFGGLLLDSRKAAGLGDSRKLVAFVKIKVVSKFLAFWYEPTVYLEYPASRAFIVLGLNSSAKVQHLCSVV